MKAWLNTYASDDGRIYLMRFFPPSINKIYSDFKLFIDRLRGYRKLKALFRERNGYELNLDNPSSFNEKIVWKKINDRNPLLTYTTDKYEVRSYIRNILPCEVANKILIPLYYVTDNPLSIPFDNLPERFVIKPNHGSRMHIICDGERPVEKDFIKKQCREWLYTNYGLYHHEWAYRNIKRKIIIEKLLQTKDGRLPLDYKFYCFHGKCKIIRVSRNRFDENDLSGYFDLNWNLLPVINPGYRAINQAFSKPDNLKEIIKLSESISKDFDAVRVDLYDCDGEFFFGELTHYDGSGLARFDPGTFDFELGAFWRLQPEYWKIRS